jgi:PAS domain S-box-containing protein
VLVALAILQEGRVVYINQACADLAARSVEELIGIGVDEWARLVHPDDVGWVRDRVSGLIESQETSPARFTYRIVLPSGEVRWVDRQSRTIHYLGKPAYILSMLDVTQVHEAERALQELQQRLISAGEQERRRLARELHDSIGQSLCALRLNLRSALSEQAEGRGASVARLDAMCEELIGEVRSLSHGLYPPALESLGLVSALRRLMRDGEAKVRCVLHFDDGLDRRRFAPEVEIALFRIAQESFSNAMRHSDASVLEIHLGARGGNVFVNILDDGKGFDVESLSGGIGLSTMRERAKAIGGNVWISSRPGRTCVEAIVPALETGQAEGTSPSDPEAG